jgi:hypothetical protein
MALVLARDGDPVAFTDSHGTWLQWLPEPVSTRVPPAAEAAGGTRVHT